MRPVVGRSARPSLWAKLIMVSLVSGSVLLFITFAHELLPAGLEVTGHDSVAAICLQIGGHFLAGLPAGGWLAGGVLGLILAGALRAVVVTRRRWRVLHVEPAIGVHLALAGGEMVVLPVSGHLALGVPGRPRQVILSQEVVDRLRPTQLEGLLRHETAHLDLAHHRFLIAGAAIEGAFGLLRPVRRGVDALRLSLERWADEVASGGSWQRREALRTAMLALAVGEGKVRANTEMVLPRLRALTVTGPTTAVDVSWWLTLGVAIAVTFAAVTGSLWVHLARLASLAS